MLTRETIKRVIDFCFPPCSFCSSHLCFTLPSSSRKSAFHPGDKSWESLISRGGQEVPLQRRTGLWAVLGCGCVGCRGMQTPSAGQGGDQHLHSLALTSPWALDSQRRPRAAAAEGLGQPLLLPWAEQSLSQAGAGGCARVVQLPNRHAWERGGHVLPAWHGAWQASSGQEPAVCSEHRAGRELATLHSAQSN